jgi:hypothetical protein
MDEMTRKHVADSLARLSEQSEWNPQVWQRCHDLVQANLEDELLGYVYDDLVHYSGVFHSYNLLGLRVKPNQNELEHYRQEFRDIATALGLGLSLSEAKQKFEL